MAFYLRLAWRNLWRNRRRTLISVSGIALSLVIVITFSGVVHGTLNEVITLGTRQFTGDLQVTAKGYEDDPTLANSFSADVADWEAVFGELPGGTVFTPRLTSFGLISSDDASAGSMVVGVDINREAEVTHFLSALQEGESLSAGDPGGVLVGRLLARNLEVGVGDTLAVLSQGYRGEMAAELYSIRGLLSTGQAEVDRNLVVMTLPAAQELFFMEGRLTHIIARLPDVHRATDVADRLNAGLLPADADLEAQGWQTFMQELVQMVDLSTIRNYIIMAFILVLVGFEIFNTTMMSVLERTREFGLLQSLGMRPGALGSLVATEWFLKLTMALSLGLVLGAGVLGIMHQYPIPIGGELAEAMHGYGFMIEAITVSFRPIVFWLPLAAIAVIALPALLYPLIRTVRQTPMDALRAT